MRDFQTSVVENYYERNVFFVEDLLQIPDLDYFELDVFNKVMLDSIIYDYPSFWIGEEDTKEVLIEYYHSTSDPKYKLFQMLVNGLKRNETELLWLGSPIFFGQL